MTETRMICCVMVWFLLPTKSRGANPSRRTFEAPRIESSPRGRATQFVFASRPFHRSTSREVANDSHFPKKSRRVGTQGRVPTRRLTCRRASRFTRIALRTVVRHLPRHSIRNHRTILSRHSIAFASRTSLAENHESMFLNSSFAFEPPSSCHHSYSNYVEVTPRP